MSSKPNFLSRLDRAGERHQISSAYSTAEIERSVVENLRRVFQIRQGNSLSAPRCGVPDFTEIFANHSDPSRKLCSTIKAVIQEYEPRLNNISVRRLSTQRYDSLRFEIIGDLEINKRRVPFKARTVMSTMDRFAVEAG